MNSLDENEKRIFAYGIAGVVCHVKFEDIFITICFDFVLFNSHCSALNNVFASVLLVSVCVSAGKNEREKKKQAKEKINCSFYSLFLHSFALGRLKSLGTWKIFTSIATSKLLNKVTARTSRYKAKQHAEPKTKTTTKNTVNNNRVDCVCWSECVFLFFCFCSFSLFFLIDLKILKSLHMPSRQITETMNELCFLSPFFYFFRKTDNSQSNQIQAPLTLSFSRFYSLLYSLSNSIKQ